MGISSYEIAFVCDSGYKDSAYSSTKSVSMSTDVASYLISSTTGSEGVGDSLLVSIISTGFSSIG